MIVLMLFQPRVWGLAIGDGRALLPPEEFVTTGSSIKMSLANGRV
jgi:hypothetical protein